MTKTIDPNTLAQPVLHNYLLSAVAPRPICWASTIDKAGHVNLSPFSFFNVFSSNPPILVFSPSRRGRDNTTKHSYDNVLEVPEVTINIVNYKVVEQMSLSSTEYEKGVNEFVKSGLTEIPSTKIKPPRVAEAPVSFECTVEQVMPLGENGGAGNLVICKVVLIHIDKNYLNDDDTLNTKSLDLVGRMGGSWYARANDTALFEIPKPLKTKGIGIDQLPVGIRESNILTGNNLGRLGNLEQLPNTEVIDAMDVEDDVITSRVKLANNPEKLKEHLHWLAKSILEEGNTQKALALLLYAEKIVT